MASYEDIRQSLWNFFFYFPLFDILHAHTSINPYPIALHKDDLDTLLSNRTRQLSENMEDLYTSHVHNYLYLQYTEYMVSPSRLFAPIA
jgi:hypothetical protein